MRKLAWVFAAALLAAASCSAFPAAANDCIKDDGPPDSVIAECSKSIANKDYFTPKEIQALAARKKTFTRDELRKIGNGKGRHFLYWTRGQAYERKGELDLAIADYDEAIQLTSGFPVVLHFIRSRAHAYFAKSNADQAITDYTKMIQIAKPDEKQMIYAALTGRATAYMFKDAHEKAIADHSEAIRMAPNHGSNFYFRGTSYYRKRDLDRAITDFEEAIRLSPKSPYVLADLGGAWRDKGDFTQAIAAYSRALELQKFPLAYTNRGLLYERLGEIALAQNDYAAALAITVSGKEPPRQYRVTTIDNKIAEDMAAQETARARLAALEAVPEKSQ